jgi:septum site-determining protein MinC
MPRPRARGPGRRDAEAAAALGDDPTLLIRRQLRSGQRVRYPGNVVVLGDVNPGAEIRAGGDIVVMGTLRGLAHAGCGGDVRAVVAAFRLEATQVRIAQFVARAPDSAGAVSPGVPEVAMVRDDQVVIDALAGAGAVRARERPVPGLGLS